MKTVGLKLKLDILCKSLPKIEFLLKIKNSKTNNLNIFNSTSCKEDTFEEQLELNLTTNWIWRAIEYWKKPYLNLFWRCNWIKLAKKYWLHQSIEFWALLSLPLNLFSWPSFFQHGYPNVLMWSYKWTSTLITSLMYLNLVDMAFPRSFQRLHGHNVVLFFIAVDRIRTPRLVAFLTSLHTSCTFDTLVATIKFRPASTDWTCNVDFATFKPFLTPILVPLVIPDQFLATGSNLLTSWLAT